MSNALVNPPGDGLPVTRIKPTRGWVALRLDQVWEYRELLYFLAWRDLKVRYKQTVLGAGWAIIQPFLTMVVFTIFFGKLAKVPSDGVPYPVFSYAGLVPWTFFANALSQSASSLLTNTNLVSKVYFPRLILPIASCLASLVDMVLATFILLFIMLYYHVPFSPTMVFLPVFALFALVTALSVGLWLSALNVEFRDIRYVIPFLIQLWLFATPIAYPASLVHGPWKVLYGLNPMVGVVQGFRWALLGSRMTLGLPFVVSAGVTVVALIGGAFYFRRTEKSFADRV